MQSFVSWTCSATGGGDTFWSSSFRVLLWKVTGIWSWSLQYFWPLSGIIWLHRWQPNNTKPQRSRDGSYTCCKYARAAQPPTAFLLTWISHASKQCKIKWVGRRKPKSETNKPWNIKTFALNLQANHLVIKVFVVGPKMSHVIKATIMVSLSFKERSVIRTNLVYFTFLFCWCSMRNLEFSVTATN